MNFILFRYLVSFVAILFFASVSYPAYAKEADSVSAPATAKGSASETEWIKAYKSWQESTAQKGRTKYERCMDFQNFLWPWAKNGNIEARALLYVSMMIPSLRQDMPNLPSDMTSFFRDTMIFYIHSAGAEFEWSLAQDDDFPELYKSISSLHQKQIEFLDVLNKGSFLTCIKNATSRKSSQACAQVAVKEGLIPPFEKYALEVEALIENKVRETCVK